MDLGETLELVVSRRSINIQPVLVRVLLPHPVKPWLTVRNELAIRPSEHSVFLLWVLPWIT